MRILDPWKPTSLHPKSSTNTNKIWGFVAAVSVGAMKEGLSRNTVKIKAKLLHVDITSAVLVKGREKGVTWPFHQWSSQHVTAEEEILAAIFSWEGNPLSFRFHWKCVYLQSDNNRLVFYKGYFSFYWGKCKEKYCVTALRRNVRAYLVRARDVQLKKNQDVGTAKRSSKKQVWWITSCSETTRETSRVKIEKG